MNRRSFLGWGMAAGSSLLLPEIVKPAPVVFDMGRRNTWHPWARYRTVRPGMWSNPLTWLNGQIPENFANVTIGHSVTIDTSLHNSYVRVVDPANTQILVSEGAFVYENFFDMSDYQRHNYKMMWNPGAIIRIKEPPTP